MTSGLDLGWLDRALALAERGRYTVSPNPMVGAVVVKNGRVVGEGFHRRAGGPHAEVTALSRAGERARGADLYVTLEPCGHVGRTPRCADSIVEAGVRCVIVASRDPNPLVSGRGLRALSRAGVDVVWADRSRRAAAVGQNEKFRVWIMEKRPFVLAKWASTLDGKIAEKSGRSRWITGPEARQRALLLREEYDAVLVGARTVAADDPLLTRRLGKNRRTPHWRIVLDGSLTVSHRARLFREPEGTLVVTGLPEDHPRARRLISIGSRVWSVPGRSPGSVDVRRLVLRLGSMGVASLLVEGGAEALGSFFRARSVDRVAVFLASRILGEERALSAVAGTGFRLTSTPNIQGLEVEYLGRDLLLTGRVEKQLGRFGS